MAAARRIGTDEFAARRALAQIAKIAGLHTDRISSRSKYQRDQKPDRPECKPQDEPAEPASAFASHHEATRNRERQYANKDQELRQA
jgi:hypothetical protein